MALDQTQGATPDGQGVYALVIYIPNPLGRFLDDLRRELVPQCNPHAHVSVLPPRYLPMEWGPASQQARDVIEGWPPFDVELSGIHVFSGTRVIYIEVGKGASDLRGMHDALNTGVLEYSEPYVYHPHITLAQEITAEQVDEMREIATRRWKEYGGSRTFSAGTAMFVRNTQGNCWEDLDQYHIGKSLAVPSR